LCDNSQNYGKIIMLEWDAAYEIVLALEALYPQVDLETIGLKTLHEMVIGLPDFADDPRLGSDAILTAILRDWFEERNNEWT
jgi:FeS assembly protein IscX